MKAKYWHVLGAILLPVTASFAALPPRANATLIENSGVELDDVRPGPNWIEYRAMGGSRVSLYVSTRMDEIVAPSQVIHHRNGNELICSYWVRGTVAVAGEDLVFDDSSHILIDNLSGNPAEIDFCAKAVERNQVLAGIAGGITENFNARKVRRFDPNLIIFGSKIDPVTPWQANIFVADGRESDITSEFLGWYSGTYLTNSDYQIDGSVSINPRTRTLELVVENKQGVLTPTDMDFGPSTCPIDIVSTLQKVTVESTGIFLWLRKDSISIDALDCIVDRFDLDEKPAYSRNLIGLGIDFADADALSLSLKDKYVRVDRPKNMAENSRASEQVLFIKDTSGRKVHKHKKSNEHHKRKSKHQRFE